MSWEAPLIDRLGTHRLRLMHGPIDLLVDLDAGIDAAELELRDVFPRLLPELCAELGTLRAPVRSGALEGPVARIAEAAALPFGDVFVTPMAAIAGSVAPDLDLIWFYLIDNRQIHHHRYLVHVPLACALVLMPLVALVHRFARPLLPAMIAFSLALLLHHLLDTPVGGILWLWPWDDRLITLVTVPARHTPWILNFLLHWSFILELVIWGIAGYTWVQTRRVASPPSV